MSQAYTNTEMTWPEWVMDLAVALDLEAEERHREYLLHGGDPKKWRGPKPLPTSSLKVGDAIFKQLKLRPQNIKRGNIHEYAKVFALQEVTKVDDKYYDAQNNEIKIPPGYTFTPG